MFLGPSWIRLDRRDIFRAGQTEAQALPDLRQRVQKHPTKALYEVTRVKASVIAVVRVADTGATLARSLFPREICRGSVTWVQPTV